MLGRPEAGRSCGLRARLARTPRDLGTVVMDPGTWVSKMLVAIKVVSGGIADSLPNRTGGPELIGIEALTACA